MRSLFVFFREEYMRYHYRRPNCYISAMGQIYRCDHPVYSKCTLFLIRGKGLAVIQQRFNPKNKTTCWSEIDPWLADEIFRSSGFMRYFNERARTENNGLYPTVSVRQIMWALRIKPMKKQRWETVFDRKEV